MKGPPDAQRRYLVGLLVGDIRTVITNLAARGQMNPGNKIEDGRLAGSVRTYQSNYLTRVNVHAEIIDRRQSHKLLGQSIDLKQHLLPLYMANTRGFHLVSGSYISKRYLLSNLPALWVKRIQIVTPETPQ